MKENKAKKKWMGWKFYLWTASFLLMLVVIMFFTIEKPYERESAREVIGSLSNCFTVPGVLFAGIGGLSYISKLGGYDGLVYSFKNFGLHNIFVTNPKKKKTQTFYEYKTEKDEKGRKWLPNFLFTGIGALAISFVLLLVYFIL